MAADAPKFEVWAETRPMTLDIKNFDIESLPLFTEKKAKAKQEIIVEPREVQDILNELLQLQSPQQAEIRKRRLREEAAVPMATILAFQA